MPNLVVISDVSSFVSCTTKRGGKCIRFNVIAIALGYSSYYISFSKALWVGCTQYTNTFLGDCKRMTVTVVTFLSWLTNRLLGIVSLDDTECRAKLFDTYIDLSPLLLSNTKIFLDLGLYVHGAISRFVR